MKLPEVCVCYLLREGPRGIEVLLGTKRRGLGRGKTVAPGGKLESRESAAAAAVREVAEETAITVAVEALRSHGKIDYFFPDRPAWSQRSWVFSTWEFSGEPLDSDELILGWVPLTEIPWDRMWDDARYWLPAVLRGENVAETFSFGPDNSTAVERGGQTLAR